jgi:formamidopyrimidine-DNA glycosylase
MPEVETTAAELRERLVGRVIERVEVTWDRSIGYPAAAEFVARMRGRAVRGVSRRAKYIVVELDGDERLVVHMRMTGQLLLEAATEPPQRFARVIFFLDDGRELRFADQRKFGRLYLVTADEFAAGEPFPPLGPEPLDDTFTPQVFEQLVAARKGVVKPLLLDQSFVAGLGNIYADEALYHAGLHPQRAVGSLSPEEVARLYEAIRLVLARAVAGRGTSFSTYRTTWGLEGLNQHNLGVFRRTDEPCYTCGTPIRRITLGGRGTHFCPHCQT